jgi:hypothetical protein
VPPHDTLQDIRSEIVLGLMNAGVQVEVHHHEVSTAGQNEIDMKFAPLVRMADNVMIYKYFVKNIARRHGKVATFMPKPLFADNASGMHCHQSLWAEKKNLFYDSKGWALTSELCRAYIGGLLKHAHALMAFCAPTTNSYRRLVPGYEAPVNLAMSQRNRSAAARIPMYSDSPAARRVEFRCPDPSANAYLAFAAMLMAGSTAWQPTPIRAAAGQEHLRAAARGGAEDRQGSGLARRISARAGERPRVPDARRTCSRATSSRRGSSTSGRTRSIRCGCGPIRGSSSCTSTSDLAQRAAVSSAFTGPTSSARRTQRFPLCLPAYIAASARLSSQLGSSPSSGMSA